MFPCSECEHWFDKNLEERNVDGIILYTCYWCRNFPNLEVDNGFYLRCKKCQCSCVGNGCFACICLAPGGCSKIEETTNFDRSEY